jgi:hypothetical protein
LGAKKVFPFDKRIEASAAIPGVEKGYKVLNDTVASGITHRNNIFV